MALRLLDGLSAETGKVLGLIQKKGPVTKSTLMKFTGMKRSTLNRAMLPLEEKALVFRSGIERSTGGRKPDLYDVDPEACYAVGIDISRTYAEIVVTNMKLDIVGKQQFPMNEDCTPEKTVRLVSEALENMRKQLCLDKSRIVGAGVGTVGPLDRENGIMTHPVNFPSSGWGNAPIKHMLETALGLPVTVDNGANAAVLAEYLFGVGKDLRSVAYFNCGIGIRTGAISAGSIIRTINDAEDAFGHMVIDVDGERCSCGNYGCIECYASIMAIVRKFTAELKKGRTSVVSGLLDEIDYTHICGAAENGDSLAREIVAGAAVIFGTGLANYINLLAPDLIILSGPLIRNSALFYELAVETALKKHYLKENNRISFRKFGRFGDDAIAVGSTAMVFEEKLGRAGP